MLTSPKTWDPSSHSWYRWKALSLSTSVLRWFCVGKGTAVNAFPCIMAEGLNALTWTVPWHKDTTIYVAISPSPHIVRNYASSIPVSFQPSNHTNKGRGKKNLRINMTQVRDGSRSNCPMNFKFKHLIKLEKWNFGFFQIWKIFF